jgi:hypothetical protein
MGSNIPRAADIVTEDAAEAAEAIPRAANCVAWARMACPTYPPVQQFASCLYAERQPIPKESRQPWMRSPSALGSARCDAGGA